MSQRNHESMPPVVSQIPAQQRISSTLAQSILDSLHLTIAVLDAQGTITAVNEAWRQMAEQSCPAERRTRTGVGMNYLQVCQHAQGNAAEGAQDAFVGIQAVLAGTQPSFTLEYPCFLPTQPQRWYLMQVTPLARLAGAVVAHLDITSRKGAEEALQEANRRYDAFVSLASHELRTPLSGIRGCIQLVLRRLEKLLQQETTTPQVAEAMGERLRLPLEQAIGRTMVQERMIADLLDASRIQANQLEMRLRPVNLVEIVRQVTQDMRYQTPERSLIMDTPTQASIPVLADADRIGQVVSNYLRNAIKYSATAQPIILRLTPDERMARVSVTDEGPGLTPQEQQQVWERFHRLQGMEVQDGSGSGLGLGLYLCRTIIERHGGQVSVQSRKGQGSTFWFTLPLTAER